jgi:hypothetical protein
VEGKVMRLLSAVVIKQPRTFAYNFNKKLDNKYFCLNVDNKCACLITNTGVSKKCMFNDIS